MYPRFLILCSFTFALIHACTNEHDLCPEGKSRPLPGICEKLPKPKHNNEWYQFNTSDTVVVFVHGFFGDSRSTWLYIDPVDRQHSTYWPELVRIDEGLEKPSIFLGGFYTDPDSGAFDSRQASKELHEALSIFDSSKHRVLDKKNHLFITHSTGGIVTRHMLYHHSDLQGQECRADSYGVAFRWLTTCRYIIYSFANI